MEELKKLLKQHPSGMTAANIGTALWNTRPDELNPARYCRPAGRLLKRAKADGIVRDEWCGQMRLWFLRVGAVE